MAVASTANVEIPEIDVKYLEEEEFLYECRIRGISGGPNDLVTPGSDNGVRTVTGILSHQMAEEISKGMELRTVGQWTDKDPQEDLHDEIMFCVRRIDMIYRSAQRDCIVNDLRDRNMIASQMRHYDLRLQRAPYAIMSAEEKVAVREAFEKVVKTYHTLARFRSMNQTASTNATIETIGDPRHNSTATEENSIRPDVHRTTGVSTGQQATATSGDQNIDITPVNQPIPTSLPDTLDAITYVQKVIREENYLHSQRMYRMNETISRNVLQGLTRANNETMARLAEHQQQQLYEVSQMTQRQIHEATQQTQRQVEEMSREIQRLNDTVVDLQSQSGIHQRTIPTMSSTRLNYTAIAPTQGINPTSVQPRPPSDGDRVVHTETMDSQPTVAPETIPTTGNGSEANGPSSNAEMTRTQTTDNSVVRPEVAPQANNNGNHVTFAAQPQILNRSERSEERQRTLWTSYDGFDEYRNRYGHTPLGAEREYSFSGQRQARLTPVANRETHLPRTFSNLGNLVASTPAREANTDQTGTESRNVSLSDANGLGVFRAQQLLQRYLSNRKFEGVEADNNKTLAFDEFIQLVRQFRLATNTSERAILEYMSTCMTGKAFTWWTNNQFRVQTLDEFEETARTRFVRKPSAPSDIVVEFMARKQGESEDLLDYIDVMESLLIRCPGMITEAKQIRVIIDNARETDNRTLMARDFVSLKELTDFAGYMVRNKPYKSQKSTRIDRKFEKPRTARRVDAVETGQEEPVEDCEPDTEENDQPEPWNAIIDALKAAIPMRSGQKMFRSPQKPEGKKNQTEQRLIRPRKGNEPVMCMNCGIWGHRAAKCDEPKTVYCYGCGQPGVYKHACEICAENASKTNETPKNEVAGST